MPIIFACREGASLNNAGKCRSSDREWIEVQIPEFGGENPSLDPLFYAPTFLAFFVLISTAYFAGMALRTILRFIR